jgi:hypothetical protein
VIEWTLTLAVEQHRDTPLRIEQPFELLDEGPHARAERAWRRRGGD